MQVVMLPLKRKVVLSIIVILFMVYIILSKRERKNWCVKDVSEQEQEHLIHVDAKHNSSKSRVRVGVDTMTKKGHMDVSFSATAFPHVDHLSNRVQNLSNVVIDIGPDKDIHHIYSAYYDDRPLPYRPAVLMLGYIQKKGPYTLYCNFKYDDNSTRCLNRSVSLAPLLAGKVPPETYFCKINSGDGVPSHVMLSTHSECDEKKWSSPIPILNQKKTKLQEVGVCVEGTMWTADGDNEKMFKLVLEFLSMVKVLGASIVTIYSTTVDQIILQKILWLYPGFVEIYNWEDLENVVHYHGQTVLINDCIYRNMNKVRHVVLMDLDEMIYPVAQSTWPEMLTELEKVGKYASYTFSNNFMKESHRTTSWSIGNKCSTELKSMKYFERLERLPQPDIKKNKRMKMILKPSAVSATSVHFLGKKPVLGYERTYWVPDNVGFMAHYRKTIPQHGKGVEDRTALRYKDPVLQEMNRLCSLLASERYRAG
jgi:hypothetical protein